MEEVSKSSSVGGRGLLSSFFSRQGKCKEEKDGIQIPYSCSLLTLTNSLTLVVLLHLAPPLPPLFSLISCTSGELRDISSDDETVEKSQTNNLSYSLD
jgi:hypothetical protein